MKPGAAVLLLGSIVTVMSLGFASAASQPNPTVRATLTGYEETPKTLSSAGSGMFTAKIGATMIEYELSYEGLVDAFASHIHLGRPATSGGIVAFLCGGGGKPACPLSAGTVTGTIEPTDVRAVSDQGIAAGEFDELVRAILNGATYVNVHTTAFPGGEIRGHISGLAGN